MRVNRLAGAAALALSVLTGTVSAQIPAPVARLGQDLASHGATGIAPCSSCHGAQGEGVAAAGFPRLAGQSAEYLLRQLQSYADGSRNNPVMQPIAKAMTVAQRASAADYYASLATQPARAAGAMDGQTPPSSPVAGRMLAMVGSDARGFQACANCHGPEGIGEVSYPYLAGQQALYLSNALHEWKDGSRNNDASGQMQRIAQSLNDEDVAAIVAYYAGLRPPAKPQLPQPAAATPSKFRGRVVSGPLPAAKVTPVEGVGTEQGSPTSGGTQGIGGPGSPTGPPSGAPGSNRP